MSETSYDNIVRSASQSSSIDSDTSSDDSSTDVKTIPLDGVNGPHITVQRTLAIVKPDCMDRVVEIEDKILRNGFNILQKRKVHLTAEQASDFYCDHFGKMFFPKLIAYMSSAPIQVYMLAKPDAVAAWNELIGHPNPFKAREINPTCLRGIYGKDHTRNAVHGSDLRTVSHEIRFMFHDNILEPISAGQMAKNYMSKEVNPTLLAGLTALCKTKPRDPVIWLADWLVANNPRKPLIFG